MLPVNASNYYFRRLFGVPSINKLDDVAIKKIEISPAIEEKSRPTLMLPGVMERISAYCFGTDQALESARLQAATRMHGSTNAYLLKNAELINGRLFYGGLCELLLAEAKHHIFCELQFEKNESALMSTRYGNMFWGHWLLDDVIKSFVAEELGDVVAPVRTPYTHQLDYEKLIKMQVRNLTMVRFESLWVIDDHGQNRSKQLRYSALRTRLLKSIGMENPPLHPGTYLMRGLAGARRFLTNEIEVAERFRQRGFRVIDPMKLSAEEIVTACAGSNVIAGIEGSGISHGIALLAPESTLLVINPPNRFNSVYKDMVDCMEVNYAILVGIANGEDFSVELDEIDRTLDLLPN